MSGEFEFVARLADRLPPPPPGQTWIGDDAAVLADGRLVATDLLVEGVHFRSAWCTPADVGFKALAVNLSDLAAMGGEPESAVAAVAVPGDRPGLADQLLDGLVECAGRFACPLVGGDTSSGPALFVAVTVTGTSPPTGPVLRAGAQVGDTLFVTGPLGGAAAVRARLERGDEVPSDEAAVLHRPRPRLAEGRAAAGAGASAMLDLSDGMAIDVRRLARASGVGFQLDVGAIPLGPGADLDLAVGGGDDYELCFTAPDVGRVRAAFADAGLAEPVAIGTATDDDEVNLPAGGWEHPLG
jgi:thiamine-monophosphate kinase